MKCKLRSSGVLLLLVFAISGCTVQLVSKYDSRTEKSVSNMRMQLTRLFFELEEQAGEEPACTYKNHTEQYKKIWIGFDLLAMRERTKHKNKTTSSQIKVLDNGLKKLQKKHKKACLSKVEIVILSKSLTGLLDSILRFEEAKLRGAPKPYIQPTVR